MKWTRKDVAVAATRVCGYSGFCWAEGQERIYEQLDRVLVSEDWLSSHPNAMVIHLPILVSDHSTIILETDPKKEKRKRGIKLESWSLYFREDTEQAKQKDLTMKEEKMNEARVKLEFWKQRYNRKWLTHGDSGTKFLFRHVKSRQRRNEILMLQDELGNWHSSQDSIKVIFKNHFERIYKADYNTSFPSWNQPHHLTSSLPILNDSHHDQLNVPIMEEDLSKAVHQLGSLKAPRWSPSAILQDCLGHGRLILANAILAALCSHVLSVFLMPKNLTKRINLILAGYWWKGAAG
uniref:Uncharacterized protein n=1 Tax=Chenopodium quinoa TaxID=63459 RepID=A0A803MVI0_CHEQI